MYHIGLAMLSETQPNQVLIPLLILMHTYVSEALFWRFHSGPPLNAIPG